MSNEMSKAKKILFTLAVWATSFTVMWQMSEIVIVNDLYIAFPGSENIITAILSWPSLLTALASLAAGSLLKKISTKTELIFAGILMLAGIIAPMGENIYVILICSFLMAIGAGFSNTAGMAIISEVFLDEGQRASQMGYYNTAMSGLGVCITFLAGMLATNGWNCAFRVNWFAVPMLILTILFLPNNKPAQAEIAETAESADSPAGDSKKGYGAPFWIYFISMFLFFMCYSCFFTYISLYVDEHALGSTAFTGTISSLTTVGSMISCVVFGFMYQKMHRKYSLLVLLLPILTYAWMYLAPSTAAAAAGSLIYGFSYGGIFTMVYVFAAELVAPEQTGMVMGLMTFNYSIAITVGTYLFSTLMSVTGGGITSVYPYAAGILLVSLVIELICNFSKKNHGN